MKKSSAVSLNNKTTSFFYSVTLLLVILFLPNTSYAASFYDVAPPSGDDFTEVSPDNCDGPPVCANTENATNCGLPTCDGGSSWTKYSMRCILNEISGATNAYYLRGETLYSVGDKCTASHPLLNFGTCSSPSAGALYKTCCRNDGGGVGGYCVAYDADGAGALGGACRGGTHSVRCGDVGTPCGEEACGTTSTPPPAGSCTDDLRYCDSATNRIIHKHSGFWNGAECVYSYDPEGSCSSSTPSPSGPPPPPDTQKPVCNSMTLNGVAGNITVTKGNQVSVAVSVSDNVRVQNLQIFRDSTPILTSSNTIGIPSPFNQSIDINTSSLPVGNYTIVTNASDNASPANVMFGLDSNCHRQLTVIIPEDPWVPPSCSAGTFSGCRLSGNPTRCTNYGTPADPVCQYACTLANPNNYCVPGTGIITVTPDPLTKTPPACNWNSLNISSTTIGTGGGFVYYKSGSAPAPGPCDATGRCNGWTFMTGYATDGTNNFPFIPPPASAGGNYAFGLFKGDGGGGVSELLATDVVNFNPVCVSPTPTPTPPAGSGTCSIGPVGSGTSYRWGISVYPSSGSGNPIAPTSFTDGTNSQSTFTWNCDPFEEGRCDAVTNTFSYSLGQSLVARFNDGEGHSCSYPYTIPSAPAPRCSDDLDGELSLEVSVYEDPNFIPTDWPEKRWDASTTPSVCYSGVLGVSTSLDSPGLEVAKQGGEVLQASTHSCFNNNDCNDLTENSCRTYYCDAWLPFIAGNCQPGGYKSKGATCGVSTNGGNQYCDGTPPVCSDNLCFNNAECNDGNVCTNNSCPTTTDPDFPGPWSCSNTNAPIKTVCGTTNTGGDYYCGGAATPDGICYNTPAPAGVQYCKTAADCNDGNQCTNDACTPSTTCIRYGTCTGEECTPPCEEYGQGTCSITNKAPTAVCEQTPAGTPVTLCSAATGLSTLPHSTCSVPYISCSTKGANTASCCGKTNVQGNKCEGNGYCNNTETYTGPTTKPVVGAIVEVRSDECGLVHTAVTNSAGKAVFTRGINGLRAGMGDNRPGEYEIFRWTATVTPPTSSDTYKFTRGIAYVSGTKSISRPCDTPDTKYRGDIGPYGSAIKGGIYPHTPVCDGDGRLDISRSMYAVFGFEKNQTPWIQTTGGDVHSNINISTPGGP